MSGSTGPVPRAPRILWKSAPAPQPIGRIGGTSLVVSWSARDDAGGLLPSTAPALTALRPNGDVLNVPDVDIHPDGNGGWWAYVVLDLAGAWRLQPGVAGPVSARGQFTETCVDGLDGGSAWPGWVAAADSAAAAAASAAAAAASAVQAGNGIITATALTLPIGATDTAGAEGQLRVNSTLGRLRAYLGGAWRSFVRLDGDTMTGPLLLSGAPSVAAGAANKGYVDGLLTQVFDITGSQTFTRIAGAKSYTIRLGGGGGGGGGGARGAPGTATSGGGGGGGGSVVEATFLASEITADLVITIGAGGAAGAGATTASTAGGNGGAGGLSLISMSGSNLLAVRGGGGGAGGQLAANSGGGGGGGYSGAGGSATGAAGGTAGATGGVAGGSGGAGLSNSNIGPGGSGAGGLNGGAGQASGQSPKAASGGASGGGTSAASAAFAGGTGFGAMQTTAGTILAGGLVGGGNGSAGPNLPGGASYSGSGGGGNIGGNGGAGGAGGRSSGGAGGGSAEGGNGGTGGAGGPGWCQIEVRF